MRASDWCRLLGRRPCRRHIAAKDALVIDTDELDPRSVAKGTIEYFGLLSTPSSRVSYATRERAASLGLDWGR
jgi:hypothetical protein